MKLKNKILLKFDGHNYNGWQVQTDPVVTIQSEVNKALSTIYKEKISSIGSGRTDAGVHALKYFVVYSEPFQIPASAIIKALNSHLSGAIRAYSCESVDDSFRPTNDALKKEYRYLFSVADIPSPFQQKYMLNITYSLNIELMRNACDLFVGTHDFKNFHCKGSEPTSTQREIFSCSIEEGRGDEHGILPNHYYLKIVGNGFLKQMVRLIMGTLISVGREKISLDQVRASLNLEIDGHLASVAPPNGLYKFDITY